MIRPLATLVVLMLLAGTASAQTGEVRKADPARELGVYFVTIPPHRRYCTKVSVWYSRIPAHYQDLGDLLLSLPDMWRSWQTVFDPGCQDRYLFELRIGNRQILTVRAK